MTTWTRRAEYDANAELRELLNRAGQSPTVHRERVSDAADRLGRGVVTVVPVTSNIARVFPFQVLLRANATGLRVDSKAQAEQVRSVTVERIGPVLGRVPAQVMAEVDEALRLHLQL